jgi:hypothetical protein
MPNRFRGAGPAPKRSVAGDASKEDARAAQGADRARHTRAQAAHLQAGVQVGLGWHLHAEPHLQVGPQAQDAPLLFVATLAAVEIESRPLLAEFI